METISFTRKRLYDLIWSLPITTIATKYHVSPADIRKACVQLDVPVPQLGHWQRLRHNKEVVVHKLNVDYQGKSEIVIEKLSTREPVGLKNAKQNINTINDIEESIQMKTSKPDHLVLKARKVLESRERFIDNGLITCYQDILDITVSKDNLSRALNFFDLLIKALNTKGYLITIEHRKTYIRINEEKFQIAVREKLQRSLKEKHANWSSYNYSPTGMLIFKLDGIHKKEWIDNKQKIEQFLPNIIIKLEEVYKQTKERAEQARVWHEEYEKKRQIEREESERVERELALFKDLLAKARRFKDSCLMREYINAVVKEKGSGPNVQEWIQWARDKADWYDPTIGLEVELLKEVDLQTLMVKQKNRW